MNDKLELITPTKAQLKARRSRNIALGIALVIFIVIVYAVTIVKLGPGIVANRTF